MHRFAAIILALALPTRAAAGSGDFFYTEDAASLLDAGASIVDSRPLAACRERSLKEARCLPPGEFLGPHRRLAAIPDVLWVLGTAGLSGAETVLVIGDEPTARDFVAGLLYLAGQRQVAVLRAPITALPPDVLAPGAARSITREKVFQASMRDDFWLLRGELKRRLAESALPILLDGRSESEFWGETVRAMRGGHLPGAESLPATNVRASLSRGDKIAAPSGEPVVYAHDIVESLAFFTLLRAGAGMAARVYPGGWAEWASDGGLAADAVTYPDRIAIRTAMPADPHRSIAFAWLPVAATVIAGVLLAAGGFCLGRRSRDRRRAT